MTYLRANVEPPSFPVSLSRQLSRQSLVTVERNVVHDELPLLAHGIDGESARRGGLYE